MAAASVSKKTFFFLYLFHLSFFLKQDKYFSHSLCYCYLKNNFGKFEMILIFSMLINTKYQVYL